MTDKEISKALECCKKPVGAGACKDCPLDKGRPCTTTMIENALDIINRQQAEIVRLKSMNQAKLDTIHDLQAENEALNEKLQMHCTYVGK